MIAKEKFLVASTISPKKPLTLIDKIIIAQKEDQDIADMHAKPGFEDSEDCLLFRGRIVIPKKLRLDILKACHDSTIAGHPGNKKTFELISRSYWWPTCRRDCKSYVDSCDVCARSKSNRCKPAGLLHPLPIPRRPWESISMDMITDLPKVDNYDSILVVVDRFTKMAHFIPCSKTLTAAQLADLFNSNIVRLHGLPKEIISDRGSIFVSQFWSLLLKNLRIEQKLSSAYHPQSDGQTERVNQCLEQYLRIFSDHLQTNWLKNLSMAELSYNLQYHSSIKMSPFNANYGYDVPMDLSTELVPGSPPTLESYLTTLRQNVSIIQEELKLAEESSKHFADKKRRHQELKVGDKVYLDRRNIKTNRPCEKLDWKQLGPFPIIKKVNPVAFMLKLPDSMKRLHNVFHISLLSKFKEDHLWKRNQEQPPPIIIDDSGEYYEVEDILDAKRINGKMKYLVSWKGYGCEENSWEPKENLLNCDEVLNDFKHRYPDKWKHAPRGGSVRTATTV